MIDRSPRLARWLAGRVIPASHREFALGDLEEQFASRAAAAGRRRAALAYWRQVAGLAWHADRRRGRPAVTPRHGDSVMRHVVSDMGHAIRALARQPAYVLAAILSLALAIAANGIVYGVVDGIVLRPFPLPDPDRLVSIGSTFPKLDAGEGFIEQHSTLEIEDLRAARTLTQVAAFDLGNRSVSDGTKANRVFTALVIDDPLPALGRPALHGRGFTKDELVPGGPAVAVLSHRLWMTQFGGDPGIVGRTVRVNGVPRLVVGVTDEKTLLLGTDLWIPWGGNPLDMPRSRRQFTVIARLAPGASLADANAELATIAGRTAAAHLGQFPEYEGWRLRAATWAEAVTGETRQPAMILLGAGVLVLLIASANLTSLMLVRLSARRREIAVRFALGAGAWQVTRLILIESLLLASVACAIGLGLASLALPPLMRLMPEEVVSAGLVPAVNLRVIAYCSLFALAAALVTALAPAMQARRTDPQHWLRDGAAAGSRQRLRQTLVVAELALAIVLLIGAGQMLSSFVRLQRADPGFDMSQVATMRLTLAFERYGQGTAAPDFFTTLVERMTALPDVTAAAAVSQFPPRAVFTQAFRLAGSDPAATPSTVFATVVTPGVFDVLGMPLRHGRRLGPEDREGAPLAVVVNEAFMRRYLDGRPEGRLIVGSGQGRTADVVGVVGDARNSSMLRPAQPELFVTIDQAGGNTNQYFLLARTTGEPLAAVASIQRVLGEMDPDQPLYVIQSLEDAVAGSLFVQRVALMLVGVFAIGSLAIAAIGVFGVVAFWVATRSREIGIRIALGATRAQVTQLIVRQTTWLLAIATTIGAIGGVLVARASSAVLYGRPALDPLAVAAVLLLLVAVGLTASWVPSRRAVRVDPARVLRVD